MTQVRATKNFPGSTINRDELGVVTEGQELEVSPNDATFLEREGLVERIEEPAAATAETGGATGEPAGGSSDPEPKGKAPAGTGKQQKQD